MRILGPTLHDKMSVASHPIHNAQRRTDWNRRSGVKSSCQEELAVADDLAWRGSNRPDILREGRLRQDFGDRHTVGFRVGVCQAPVVGSLMSQTCLRGRKGT